jgi:hypothetical protein
MAARQCAAACTYTSGTRSSSRAANPHVPVRQGPAASRGWDGRTLTMYLHVAADAPQVTKNCADLLEGLLDD